LPSVEPGGSPEPHTFRSRLLDGFFNPVAAFGSVNIDGDLMLYAGLIEQFTWLPVAVPTGAALVM